MAAIGQYIYNYLSSAMTGINLNGSNHATTPYKPSVADVLSVKDFFHTERDQKLPVELINTIIDYAEYWPHTTTIAGPNVARGNTTKENVFILRSFPLGFPPSNDHYQISKDGLEKYPSTAPTPWPESNNTPGNSTEELLREWAKQSHTSVEHPCRKIVFYITSHDQGHGGGAGHRGTYHGAYSWFDVGLETVSGIREKHFLEAWNSAPRPQFEISPPPTNDGSLRLPIFCCLQTINPPTAPRPLGNTTTPDTPNHIFDHSLLPSPQRLQSNVVAERQSKEHIITWSYNDDISPESPEGDELENSGRGKNTADGEFIRSLKIGDVVTVWAKARFPMWSNVVEEVKIEVYWAV